MTNTETYKDVINRCQKCGHQILKPRNGEKKPCQYCLENKIKSNEKL